MEDFAFVLIKVVVDVATERLFDLPPVHQINSTAIVAAFQQHTPELLNECTLSTPLGPAEINVGRLVLLATFHELLYYPVDELLSANIAVAIDEVKVMKIATLCRNIVEMSTPEFQLYLFVLGLVDSDPDKLTHPFFTACILAESHHIHNHLLLTAANQSGDVFASYAPRTIHNGFDEFADEEVRCNTLEGPQGKFIIANIEQVHALLRD